MGQELFKKNTEELLHGHVRTRIAPSPTGNLHVGTARSALFNYLFAKRYGGAFVLRIEDTDLERSDKKFEKDIIDGLRWLGIDWDEGVEVGGEYAPYRQTERTAVYSKYIQKLLEEEKAYYCFCSLEELEADREKNMKEGKPPVYSGKCRDVSREEALKMIAEEKKAIIRLKMPDKTIEFDDLVRGQISFDGKLIGDISIAKGPSVPLYNFAVVVDDYEMKINHVIRGEDHISNTPKQIAVAEALGFELPKYGHLPLILGSDKSKMSKRHGATSIIEYKKEGYLPEAMINFMALLGWNPGDDREFFSIEELIKEFSLEKVQKGGAVFDVQKLDHINGHYIRQKNIEELTRLCVLYLVEAGMIEESGIRNQESGIESRQVEKEVEPHKIREYKITETGEMIDFEYLKKMVNVERKRMKKLSEITVLAEIFLKKPEYESELLIWKRMEKKEVSESLKASKNLLENIPNSDFEASRIKEALMKKAEETGSAGKLFWPLRIALSGQKSSPPPEEIAEVIGKDDTTGRIKTAIDKLSDV